MGADKVRLEGGLPVSSPLSFIPILDRGIGAVFLSLALRPSF